MRAVPPSSTASASRQLLRRHKAKPSHELTINLMKSRPAQIPCRCECIPDESHIYRKVLVMVKKLGFSDPKRKDNMKCFVFRGLFVDGEGVDNYN